MSKNTCKILAVFAAILMLLTSVPFSASAADIVASGSYDDISWELDKDGTIVFSGEGFLYDAPVEYCDQIKKIVIGEGITAIGEYAFFDCHYVTSVSLPESLTELGIGVFSSPMLTTLHMPANVKTIMGPVNFLGYEEYWKALRNRVAFELKFNGYTVAEENEYFSVDEQGNLFDKNKTRLIHHPMKPLEKEYVVPDTVKVIGKAAFAYNFTLEKVTLPYGVESIESKAFDYNLSLNEINFPSSISKFGDYMFDWGHSISEFTVTGKMNCKNLPGGIIPAQKLIFLENIQCKDHYDEYDEYYNCSDIRAWKEVVVYTPDMDFSYLTLGFIAIPIKEEYVDFYYDMGLLLYRDIPLYNLGLSDDVDPMIKYEQLFELLENEDELYDYDAEKYILNGEELYKIPGFTVRCYPGSTAEEYAKKYGFNLKYICDEHTEETIPAVLPTCTQTGLTEGVKCAECDEILISPEIVPASGHDYKAVVTAPTCTQPGFTSYVCACSDSYEDDITEPVGHKDADNNKRCDNCNEQLSTEDNDNAQNTCSHMCHKSGFMGFIWKIVNFFGKLFGTNPVCECGAAHY